MAAKTKFGRWITSSSWSPFSWLFDDSGDFSPLDFFNANSKIFGRIPGMSGVTDLLQAGSDLVSGKGDGDLSLRDALTSWLKSMSGAGLTNAQMQQNEWNEQMAVNAYDRSREARQTQFQDLVGSAQAAGINPMMAVTGGMGSSAVSAPSSSGSSPQSHGIQDLIALFQLKSQIDLTKMQKEEAASQIGLNEALGKKATAEAGLAGATAKRELSEAAYKDALTLSENEFRELRKRAFDDSHNMSQAEVRKIYKDIDVAEQQIAESKDRQGYYIAESVLANANAYQIKELTPVLKAYHEAQTEEAKSAAALQSVKTFYEWGLISQGVIEKTIQQMDANISAAEASAQAKKLTNVFRSGDDPEHLFWPDNFGGRVFSNLIAAMNLIKETALGGIISVGN